MTRTKTRITTIRLPEDLYTNAETVARIDGITISELIRRAIHDHLTAETAEPGFRDRLEARMERDRRIMERLTQD